MEFFEAEKVFVNFGRPLRELPVARRLVGEIAKTSWGLGWMVWMRAQWVDHCEVWQRPVRAAIERYLTEPAIAAKLERAGSKKRGKKKAARVTSGMDFATRERLIECGQLF